MGTWHGGVIAGVLVVITNVVPVESNQDFGQHLISVGGVEASCSKSIRVGVVWVLMRVSGDRMTVEVLYVLCILPRGVCGVIADANQSVVEERRRSCWSELFWGLFDNHSGC